MTEYAEEEDRLSRLFAGLARLETKGELGEALAAHVETISVYDLAMVAGDLERLILNLPAPYGKALRPYMQEKLFGGRQRMLTMRSAGGFRAMGEGIRDKAVFRRFCETMAGAREDLADPEEEYGRNTIAMAALYCLTSCFAMFVMDEPGHPVGMPFPGGFSSYARDGVYYCPVKDREKDVKYAFCNFCPARQANI